MKSTNFGLAISGCHRHQPSVMAAFALILNNRGHVVIGRECEGKTG